MVLTVHDTIYEDDPTTAAALDPQGVARARHRDWLDAADTIIVPSKTTASGLLRHHPNCPARIVVIPHGIHAACLAGPVPAAQGVVRKRLTGHGIRTEFLLYVGGREHYKNFTWLLRAYGESELWRRFALVAVGSQPHALPAEDEAIAELPRQAVVAFLGQVGDAELAALYRSAAAYVTVSQREGFGLPVIEAAACGTPVVCPAVDIFEETISLGATSYTPLDPDDLTRAVVQATRLPAARRRAVATHVATRYSWDRTVAATVAAYGNTVGLST